MSPRSDVRLRSVRPWRRKFTLAAATGAAMGSVAAWTTPSSPGAPRVPVPFPEPERPGDAATEETPGPSQCLAPPPSSGTGEKGASLRVHAKTRFVWIREAPSWSAPWIGYLWSGGSVALSSPEPTYAYGCAAWYSVVPRGFVCVDGENATLDATDPAYRSVTENQGDFDAPSPHRYAESLGVERYLELPEPALQRAREPDLRAQEERIRAAREDGRVHPFLEGVDLRPAESVPPPFLELSETAQIRRNTLRRRSTIAYVSEHLHIDRTFLLTADLAWVPKDRVRPYPPVTFAGVHLDGSVRLPLAFFREQDRTGYRRSGAGPLEPAGKPFRRLEWVSLTGNETFEDGHRFLETTRDGLWARADEAVVPKAATATPWGAPTFQPDTGTGRPGRATWVEVSINGGWLIAYEGPYPVFTTLIAPGIGGAARPGRDPLATSASPTGHFTVTGKFLTATLDAPTEVVHADVPWVMNFSGPYALHGAYWHDAWGERKSGGCINLSPADGKWLFAWTEPRVPAGWHGARLESARAGSTAVWIHR